MSSGHAISPRKHRFLHLIGPGITDAMLQSADALIAAQHAIGEGQHFDRKQEYHVEKGKQDLAADVAAFANADGGLLIVGVGDRDRTAYPVDLLVGNQPYGEWVQSVVNERCVPPLPVDVEPLPVSLTQGVILIAVHPSPVLHSVRDPERRWPKSQKKTKTKTKTRCEMLGFPLRVGETTRWLQTPREIDLELRERQERRTDQRTRMKCLDPKVGVDPIRHRDATMLVAAVPAWSRSEQLFLWHEEGGTRPVIPPLVGREWVEGALRPTIIQYESTGAESGDRAPESVYFYEDGSTKITLVVGTPPEAVAGQPPSRVAISEEELLGRAGDALHQVAVRAKACGLVDPMLLSVSLGGKVAGLLWADQSMEDQEMARSRSMLAAGAGGHNIFRTEWNSATFWDPAATAEILAEILTFFGRCQGRLRTAYLVWDRDNEEWSGPGMEQVYSLVHAAMRDSAS